MKEFIEIFLYVTAALITQLMIKKFLLSTYSLEGSGFISKIPEEYRSNIYLIQSKENYIDVFYGSPKENRHKLINYRFSNAIKEMEEDRGLQVHRSFWVSRATAKNLRKVGRKYYLTSLNNETIPVSQTYIKIVKHTKENLD